MSFFNDLFSGNFSQLGGDLTSPSAISEYEDTGIALGALALGGAGLGALGAFGAADAGALGALGADAATTGGTLATDLGLGDIGAAAAADSAATAGDIGAASLGTDASLAAPTALDATSLTADPMALTDSSGFLTQDAGATTAGTATPLDATSGVATATPAAPTAPTAPGAPGATPAGFASTDAELTGGVTGTAPTGTTPAAAAAPGTATSTLGSVLSSPWTKLAVGAAPLALTLGMGQQQLPASAQALQAQALQMQQTGLTNLSQAQAGVMNAGQTAQLGQMRSDLTNQWLQTLKNQGVQDPTKDARWPQIQAAIDAQVTQQTATLVQNNINAALAETGQAASALNSIAQMQMTSDQQFTNNLIGATKSLGVAAGTTALPKITIGS
jgi:hypothetical protein